MKSPMNPYLAGALSGLLLVLSVLLTGHFFGASSTYVRQASLIKERLSPIVEGEEVMVLSYLERYPPEVNWQWMFVIGVMIGAFLISRFDGSFKAEAMPQMWKERFGASRLQRWTFAFIGGALAMFGARMAGGCPSGHGLSGLSQFSVSGFIAMAGFFGGGVIVANYLYRWSRR
jgi:uncharacterized membrane protein YedE/YeeE